jgi:hypothetical protein
MTTTAQKKWNPWPVCLIGFFTLAILGCAGFVVFCVSNPTELVATDYYEQEIRHQSQMERAGRGTELGSLASLEYDAGRRVIALSLPVTHAGASGHIHLYRPNDAALDRTIELKLDEHGRQQVDAAALRAGRWNVRVTWSAAGKDYSLDRKLEVHS